MILFLALFFRIVANPFANVFQKKLTAGAQHPLWINFAGFFLLSIACLPSVLMVDWSGFGGRFWAYCALGGALGALGNGYLIKSMQRGDLSVLGPINSYKSVVSLLFGIPLLGELPNVWGVAGMALIVWGSYFILDTLPERFSWRTLRRPEIKFRVFAMLLTAVEAIFIKKIILLSSPNVSFMVWCFFNAAFSFGFLYLFGVRPKNELAALQKKHVPLYLMLVVCVGVMQLATNYAFARMPVGYALALFQLSSIAAVLLGWRFFHETDIRKKLVGASIMMAGAAAIILLR